MDEQLANWSRHDLLSWFNSQGIVEVGREFDIDGNIFVSMVTLEIFEEMCARHSISSGAAKKYYDNIMRHHENYKPNQINKKPRRRKRKNKPKPQTQPQKTKEDNAQLLTDNFDNEISDNDLSLQILVAKIYEEDNDAKKDFEIARDLEREHLPIELDTKDFDFFAQLGFESVLKVQHEEDILKNDSKIAIEMEKHEYISLGEIFTDNPQFQRTEKLLNNKLLGYHNAIPPLKFIQQKSNFCSILSYKQRFYILLDPNPLQISENSLREEILVYLCWVGIHLCGFTVFGGFVRDYLIRGDKPNDIDFRIYNDDDLSFEESVDNFVNLVNNYEIIIELNAKHDGLIIGTFSFGDCVNCTIDFVAGSSFNKGTTVDFDVNNFQINACNKVHQRVDIGLTNEQVLNSISRKVACPIEKDEKRIAKMRNKGWEVIDV